MYVFSASVLHVWVERGQTVSNHYPISSARDSWEYEDFVNYCISQAQSNSSYGHSSSTSINVTGAQILSDGHLELLQTDIISAI